MKVAVVKSKGTRRKMVEMQIMKALGERKRDILKSA